MDRLMIEWTPKRRENAVRLLSNASTILLGTLIVGNVIAGKSFNAWMFSVGMLLYVVVVVLVLVLEK